MKLAPRVLAAAIASGLALSMAAPGYAAQTKGPGQSQPADPLHAPASTEFLGVVQPEVLSVDVRNDPVGLEWQPGDPIREVPRRHWDDPAVLAAQQREPVNPPEADPLAALQQALDGLPPQRGAGFTTPLQNFEGAPGTTLPPDPTGDIGTTQYVQAVNASGGSRVRVYNKATGELQANFILATTLTGTSPCDSGLGDPIVLFDAVARRWVVTEFSPSAGRALCVYVSATEDAANTAANNWSRYTFVMPAFPDYPKYGVWTDAYYATANENGTGGARPIYAFERAAMLQGQPARFVRVTVPNLAGFNFQLSTPAHLVGDTPPPANAPGIIMRHRDDEAHNAGTNNPSNDFLELWQLSMDWAPATPTGTLTPVHQIPVAEFNSRINGLTAFNAFPQPSGQRLDPLREPIMNVLMYRNFGTYESIVGNHTTNTLTDPQIRGAIRWFELRRTAGTAATAWQLHDQGTFAPTDTGGNIDRWMGGSGIDSAGNIALAYSVVRQAGTPAGIFPGLRYTGRLASDPPGVMTGGDNLIVSGERSQGNERWGDYHQMGVDPVDGCTFWFTGEYMGPAGTTNNTRIASFRHDACGEPGFTLNSSLRRESVCVAAPPVALPPATLTIGQISGFTTPVALAFNPALPSGITGAIGTSPVTPPGTSSLALTLGAGVAPGLNTVTVRGTSGSLVRNLDIELDVATQTPGAPAPVTPANGATNVLLQPTLSWTAGAQSSSHTVEVATDTAFTNIVFTGNVSSGSSIAVTSALASNAQHYWRVRPANVCGAGTASPVFSFRTQPAPGDCAEGSIASTVFTENFTAGAGGFTVGGTGAQTWALSTTRPSPASGGNAMRANGIATVSDQQLTSPAISLPTGQQPLTLRYQNWRNLENNAATGCYDAGLLEISVDGGAFTQLAGTALLNDPYRGPISSSFGNPLGGRSGWCEPDPGRAYANTLVDLSPYAGSSVRLRWRVGTDSSEGREGWYVDDIAVQSCVAGDPVDLTATMTAPANAVVGSTASLTVAVANLSTVSASAVTVALAMDPAFTIQTATGTGWTCSIGTPQQATCTRSSLAGEATSPVIAIEASVSAAAIPGAKTVSATVSAGNPDPVGANNTGSATVTVLAAQVFRNGFEATAPNP
ncbi:MAG: hypothetical protein H4O13_11640 [Xanthomonadales bacterium]|nr:hypothetical protein [Xanthomonadales bacterium]